jgi:hypothetical protein
MAAGDWRKQLENLESNEKKLLEQIDTCHGLYGALLELDSDSFQELFLKKVWDMDVTQRNEELLEHVKKGGKNCIDDFCHALRKSGQTHIVSDYLLKSGPCQDEGDGAAGDSTDCSKHGLPMSPETKSKLRSHWEELLNGISSGTDLLNELQKRKVFKKLEIMGLKANKIEVDRNEWILKKLYNSGSESQFVEFCKALQCCNQHHLVNMMNLPMQQLESSASCSAFPTATESLDEQTTPKLPPPVSSKSSSACELRSQGSLLQLSSPLVYNVKAHGPTQPTVIQDYLPSAYVSSMTSTSFTSPLSDVVEKMKKQVKERRAYDVTYSPGDASVTRGQALIIANSNFTDPQLPKRRGTSVDISNLERLLHSLRFSVQVFENLTAQEMREKFASESQSEKHSSIFVLCILSHGRKGVVLGIDGQELSLSEIMTIFDGRNCTRLFKKPKLFFVQACQGDAMTEGVDESDAAHNDDEEVSEILEKLSLRHEKADMAIFLGTYPGYVAWRNPDSGSYFIQILTTVFQQQADEHHFIDMTMEVTRQMNEKVMGTRYKQICQVKSTLDKFVYLLPY